MGRANSPDATWEGRTLDKAETIVVQGNDSPRFGSGARQVTVCQLSPLHTSI